MSTWFERGRQAEIVDDRIPGGYSVWRYESRSTGRRWYVTQGPESWTEEYGLEEVAIIACFSNYVRKSPLVPDEEGMLPCYLCRGTADQSMNGKPCMVCTDTVMIHVVEMARHHDGRVRLAEVVGPMSKDGVLPTWMKLLGSAALDAVSTLARNPCKKCGTYLLEPEWVGSAYCSRRCCVDDYQLNPGYARSILEGYDEEHRKQRAEMMRDEELEAVRVEVKEGF